MMQVELTIPHRNIVVIRCDHCHFKLAVNDDSAVVLFDDPQKGEPGALKKHIERIEDLPSVFSIHVRPIPVAECLFVHRKCLSALYQSQPPDVEAEWNCVSLLDFLAPLSCPAAFPQKPEYRPLVK